MLIIFLSGSSNVSRLTLIILFVQVPRFDMATRTFSRSLSLNLKPTSDVEFIKETPKTKIVRITPYLSLGSENDAAGDVKAQGITHLLNVSISSPNIPSTDCLKYKKIPLKDYANENIKSVLEEAFEFIDEARRSSGHILVYCYAGISRSVTITVAYMMVRNNMLFDEAYSYVKSLKSDISPNIGFIGQLHQLEQSFDQNRSDSEFF